MSTGYQANQEARFAESETTADDAKHRGNEPRSFAGLVRELRDESTVLLREEIALAKSEMSEKVSRVSRNIAMMIAGGAVAHLGLIFLLLAASEGIQVSLMEAGILLLNSVWVAPLIVGLVIGIIGTSMLVAARNKLKHMTPLPERTVQSLKEDKKWVQNKTK